MWQFISNVSTFIIIYYLSTFIARYMRAFKPAPKLIYFKSPTIFNFVTFPISFVNKIFDIKTKNRRKKAISKIVEF